LIKIISAEHGKSYKILGIWHWNNFVDDGPEEKQKNNLS
jgi:hypothetical protein